MANQIIELNVTPGIKITETVNVSQYDIGRILEFHLVDGVEREVFEIPEGAVVYVNAKKADGHAVSYSTDTGEVELGEDDGVVLFTTTQQFCAAVGMGYGEIRVTCDGDDLGTANFNIKTERAPVNDDSDLSETEIPAIVALAREQEERAAESATLARSYARGDTDSRTGEETDNAYYYNSQAAASASNASGFATLSQSYAVGGTGTRSGEDNDNAKKYKELAATSASNASTSETNAASSETNASNSAASAAASLLSAVAAATQSESYAVGGTNSRIGEDTDNSEYYKNISESWAKGNTGLRTGENTNNSKYFSEVSEDYSEDSEAWAVGQRGGVDVASTDTTYHNNSEYYAGQAALSASSAAATEASIGQTIGAMSGMFQIDPTDGHLYVDDIAGFDGTWSIIRSTGHMQVVFA